MDQQVPQSAEYQNVDTMLDSVLGTGDNNAPSPAVEIAYEQDNVTYEPEPNEAGGMGAVNPEAEGNEASAAAAFTQRPADELTAVRMELEEMRAREALRAQQDLVMQQQAVQQYIAQLRETMTEDEFLNYQAQTVASYAQTLERQLHSVLQHQHQNEFEQREAQAKNYVIQKTEQSLGSLTAEERNALEGCQSVDEFKRVRMLIERTRSAGAQTVRQQIRGERLASGADVAGGRGFGAPRQKPKDFSSVDELIDSIFQ